LGFDVTGIIRHTMASAICQSLASKPRLAVVSLFLAAVLPIEFLSGSGRKRGAVLAPDLMQVVAQSGCPPFCL